MTLSDSDRCDKTPIYIRSLSHTCFLSNRRHTKTESCFILTAGLSWMVDALSLDNIKLPSDAFENRTVWLQTCCFGATVAGCSDAPLTPSSPSAASPSLVPWSHTVRLVHSQSCSPGIDAECRCEKRRVWSPASLRGMLMQLSCHFRADISHPNGRYTTSKNSPRVRKNYCLMTSRNHVNLWHLLWSRWGALSKIICSYLILVWLPSVSVPLSLQWSRASRACYRLAFEAVRQRGLAVMSARMCTHTQADIPIEPTRI